GQKPSSAHTECMRKHFGAEIVSVNEGIHGRKIALTGEPELHGAEVIVPADPSSAAFPIVAALVVEGSGFLVVRVTTHSPRPRAPLAAPHAGGGGPLTEGKGGCAGRRASRWRACGCAPQNCAASKCRRSA